MKTVHGRLLVAVDTSGRDGSLALARLPEQDDGELVILDVAALAGGTFSAQLIPQLAELLKRHEFSKDDIGGFAVASGPGSFTGLRVGLAAVKGLAEVLGTPIVVVSLLEALANGRPGLMLAALDAGRNELYVGEYKQGVSVSEERLAGRIEFVESAELKVVTTDARLAETLATRNKLSVLVEHPGSAGVARLGWRKLRGGERVAPEELEANYIRRSDAEIFSKPQV
jgi:tRNA threonylcarbamoyladenosine biosynthesis protein TsaB